MDKIIEKIDSIYTTVKLNPNVEKSSLHASIVSLDDLLCSYLADINLDTSKYDGMFMDTKEQIKVLDKKINEMSTNSTVVLKEVVAAGEEKLRDFLKMYNIGFIKDFYLNEAGVFNVELPCLISKHTAFHEKDYSKNIEFEKQMNFLKEIGLDMGASKTSPNASPVILATQNSIDVLTKLMTGIGAYALSFETRLFKGQTTISHMNFRIKPEKLFGLKNDVSFYTSCATTNVLNEDEQLALLYELKELRNTCFDYDDADLIEAKPCCKNIVLHSFSRICTILNINTTISNSVSQYNSKSKKDHEIIAQKRSEIKEKLSIDTIDESVGKIMSTLEFFSNEKLGFSSGRLNISPYSMSTQLRFNPCGYALSIYNDDVESLSEKELKEIFDCSDGSFENETLVIKNTERNFEKLNEIIQTRFNAAQIESMEVSYNIKVGYYINKINVVFPDLSAF